MQTSIRININGVITAPDDARISVLDHGFLFGDSVYEALRTYGGKPFLFSRHFGRLEHSAAAVHLRLPWSKSKTLEEIRKTCLPGECRIRVIVTRGIGDLSPGIETCAGPTVIIIVVPLAAPDERIYSQGVEVVISSIRRGKLADVKTGSLIHQVMARYEADQKNAYEAVLLTADDKLSDGITSNIYMVRSGKILTPSHEAVIVEGITRGVVLDLARAHGIEVREGLFDAGEIGRADEMFLTSSTREVVPITRANGVAIGDGKPGPITLMLLDAYRSAVEQLMSED